MKYLLKMMHYFEDTDNSTEEDADTSKIIPFIMERYAVLKIIADKMKNVGYVLIVTIVVYMVQMYSLQRQKSLVCLLK
jgi:hypothetical protein